MRLVHLPCPTTSNSLAGATFTGTYDLQLACATDHYRECFLESDTITECPHCSKSLSSLDSTGKQQVLCRVHNEGGIQEGFDILPTATDEAYLRTYPEERKGHAFLVFCQLGDLDALIHLIQDGAQNDEEDEEEENEDEEGENLDVLRYTGSFDGIDGSGLHVAIKHDKEEVGWLLLVLGSSLKWSELPPQVLSAIEEMNISIEDRTPSPDIRTLKDSQGRTAAALAKEVGGRWAEWDSSGRLDPPT